MNEVDIKGLTPQQREGNYFFESKAAFHRFFLDGQENINMLVRSIDPRIFNDSFEDRELPEDILSELRIAVEKYARETEGTINIVTKAIDMQATERVLGASFILLVQKIFAEMKDRVSIQIYQGDNDWLSDVPSSTTVDGKGYRLRPLESERDDIGTAAVCFNDPDTVKKQEVLIADRLDGVAPLLEWPPK